MKPFIWQNEKGKRLHADITRLVEGQRWFRALFGYGKDLPNEKRRYYMRAGKQAYEIGRWFQDPLQAAASKSSPVVHTAYELFTGRRLGSPEWELGFHDMGLAGTLMSERDGFMGSQAGYVVRKFLPFSMLAAMEDVDKVPLGMIAPVSKGMSQYAAVTAMTEVLNTWAHAESYLQVYSNPRIKANLERVGGAVLDAAKRNGLNPQSVLSSARGAAVKDYYAAFYRALKAEDTRAAEKAARSLMRLNAKASDALRSITTRERLIYDQKVAPELRSAARESFKNPLGPRRK
jgi:hypothetical protein